MNEKGYRLLALQIRELSSGVTNPVTILANASAAIYWALGDINWAGFYILEGKDLILGPFQGKPACTVIPEGRGVCGKAASENRTVIVPDVHEFEGHIACDSASRSEIVVPVMIVDRLYGVLDIDSPLKDRFCDTDADGLGEISRMIGEALAVTQVG